MFDVFKLTFSDLTTATVPVGVTTSNLGARMVGRMVSQPKLEVNDWDGRGFCWMTLTAPFKPAPGAQILHIEATHDSNATPVFVLRQGSRTLFEGPLAVNNGMIEENFGFRCKRYAGNLYILVRLADGEGTFTLKDMYWTPYGEGLVKDTNIVLPGNLRIISK